MPNESPNVLRLRILNNYEISVKCLNPAPGQPSAQPPPSPSKMKTPPKLDSHPPKKFAPASLKAL